MEESGSSEAEDGGEERDGEAVDMRQVMTGHDAEHDRR